MNLPRVELRRVGTLRGVRKPTVGDAKNAAEAAWAELKDDVTERVIAFLVDGNHRVIAVTTVALGSVHGAIIAPGDPFRAALVAGARAIILAHNHPSGDATPSGDDRRFTEKLVACGKVVGVQVLDHVVVSDQGWESCMDMGRGVWPREQSKEVA